MNQPIAHYAMLSNCNSPGLVGRDNSIDWLCLPRYDSPSAFARILDPDAGHWSIRPRARWKSRRRNVPGSSRPRGISIARPHRLPSFGPCLGALPPDLSRASELVLFEVAAPGRVVVPELKPGAVNAALDRGHGEVEHCGDVLVRPAFDVAQDERHASLVGKGPDALVEEGERLAVAGLDISRRCSPRAAFRPLLDHLRLERRELEPLATSPLQRFVDGDAVEPRKGGGLAAEALEVSPCLHERVLRRLVDVTLVLEQARKHGANAPTLPSRARARRRISSSMSRELQHRTYLLSHPTGRDRDRLPPPRLPRGDPTTHVGPRRGRAPWLHALARGPPSREVRDVPRALPPLSGDASG